jgi:hypothetical protein
LVHLQGNERSSYSTPVNILDAFYNIVSLFCWQYGVLYFHDISLGLSSKFRRFLYALRVSIINLQISYVLRSFTSLLSVLMFSL